MDTLQMTIAGLTTDQLQSRADAFRLWAPAAEDVHTRNSLVRMADLLEQMAQEAAAPQVVDRRRVSGTGRAFEGTNLRIR